jgi:hypothetical protein
MLNKKEKKERRNKEKLSRRFIRDHGVFFNNFSPFSFSASFGYTDEKNNCSLGMYLCVVWQMFTEVSEEHEPLSK